MSKSPSTSKKILVVEDNKTNRDLMVYLLKAFGYATSEADNGLGGIELARREHPQLIVCDIHLPQLDGYGVIRELKADAALKTTPVVAVTALAMVGDRDRILAAGFDGYVSKPIAPETFVPEIEKFLPGKKRNGARKATTSKESAEESQSVRAKQSSSRRVCETIMVVDDTPENLQFARTTLESVGYHVITTDSVKGALTLVKQQKPDVVLTDLYMVPQSGFDFLDMAKVNPALKGIPFIIISSTYTGDREVRECLKRGAARFIARPIEPEALLREIANTIREAKQS